MKYNFDEKVDRKGTYSAKWEEIGDNFISSDLLPMWIADMDFKTAPEIIEAMKKRVEHGVFGYVHRPDLYYKAVSKWVQRRFQYEIDYKSLVYSQGVVPSLSLLIRLLTKEKEKVLIQSPVYYPFRKVIENNNRGLEENNLIKDENGYYKIDFEDLEKKLSDELVKLFIFCSPHNPVGRVWKKEELEKISELCLKYNVRIVSDEIWRDIIMPGNNHIPIASISKESEKNTITCFSPTKTFNLAGIQGSLVTFPNEDERKMFDLELETLDIKRNNIFSLVSFEAAYTKCDEWVEQLINYLNKNMDYVVSFIEEKLPEIKVIKPEGTYLMWLDFSKLNMGRKELGYFLQIQGRVALDEGYWFGENGEGYERINIACPREMLEECMKRIEIAIVNWRENINT